MSEPVTSAAKDAASKLCQSSDVSKSLTDELPSLDALSFEHEHCPCPFCRNKKQHTDGVNCSSLSAFGIRPAISKQDECPSKKKKTVKDPQADLLRPSHSFQPLSTPRLVIAHSGREAVSSLDSSHSVFGSVADQNSQMKSFAQLRADACSNGCDPSRSLAAFEQSHHDREIPAQQTQPAQGFNFSDLQSALQTANDESLPVSDCPLHRFASSVDHAPTCTCGQQAARLDDCTFDELAAYFDNFCYIPKNMSPMAEMMYM